MNETEEKKFYDLKLAIEMAATSRSTFIRAVEKLGIKAYKFPGDKKYYYDGEDIERIKQHIHSRVQVLPKHPFEMALAS